MSGNERGIAPITVMIILITDGGRKRELRPIDLPARRERPIDRSIDRASRLPP